MGGERNLGSSVCATFCTPCARECRAMHMVNAGLVPTKILPNPFRSPSMQRQLVATSRPPAIMHAMD